MALFSQESQFLFLWTFLEPPQESCLYGADVGTHVGIKKELSIMIPHSTYYFKQAPGTSLSQTTGNDIHN